MRGWLLGACLLAGCSTCPDQDKISAKYESCDLPVPEDLQYEGDDKCVSTAGSSCLADCIDSAECGALDESDPQASQDLADCYAGCS
jgi:hypothetical protein